MWYHHYTNAIPLSIHVFEIDPHVYSIVPVRALNEGRETVLSFCSRNGAIAGFNGGFFMKDGTPSGILKIDSIWFGVPRKARGAIGWRDGGKRVVFDRVLIHFAGKKISVDSQIGATSDLEWEKMEHIVGGTPLLIKDGVRIQDYSPEKTLWSFLILRHARTAVGVLPNGNWVFVVVDGKQPGLSIGMTMDELADFMEELGCVDALNLDGGGSSTFVYHNQVVNQPYGDGDDNDVGKRVLRPVSDAILIKNP